MESTNTNIREALLDIRKKIDEILGQDAPEQKAENRRSPVAECQELFFTILSQAAQKKPAHEVGGQITLHNADYGDILMDCIHPIDGGKRGLYLFHHAFPEMEFDAAEAAGRGQDYGNNDYQLSNVRAWQNSTLVDWWKRTHIFDAPPSYADKPGLLHGFDSETMARIVPFEDGDVFRLLSAEEVEGGIPYLQTEEGKKLLSKTDKNSTAVWWWLRSPDPNFPDYVRHVHTDGNTYSSASAYGRDEGVAAACVIE